MIRLLGGLAAAAAATNAGLLQASQLIPVLLTMALLHNTYDLFVGSLPRHFAVFGKSAGWKIALAGFAITQFSTMSALYLYSIRLH